MIFNPSFEIYTGGIKSSKPHGVVDLNWLRDHVVTPDKSTRDTFTRIQIAELMQEWENKKILKEALNFITPCVRVKGYRRYSNIQSFTGMAQLDFDHLPFSAGEFRDILFKEHKFISMAWISASGRGVKALARVPIVNKVEDFKSYYWALHDIVSNYVGYDMAPQNAVLPLFLSPDPDAKFRPDAKPILVKSTSPSATLTHIKLQYKVDFSKFEQFTLIQQSVRRIIEIEDNGHPQVRAAAFTLGGYVGAGFVDYDMALSALTDAILENDYLAKGTDGYVKTAKQMLIAGMSQPLKIN